MSRSRRSVHGIPKSSPLHRNKHKKTRRSVAFATSPLKSRHISPQNEDSVDCISDDNEHNTESESESLFLWDEESTLLDALMDKPNAQPDDPSVLALTGSLREALVNRGQASKSEMAHIFVSTNMEVKNCVHSLDDEVEPFIGKELLRFNVACKDEERQCLGFAEIIEKFESHNAACNRLEEQIAAHFAECDALYARFEEFADRTLNPVLERLNNLPARNEHWMTQMFEDLKAVEKKYKKIAVSKELRSYLGLAD